MPIVAIPVDMLSGYLGEPSLDTDQLVVFLKRLGCDVDGYERIQRVRCTRCSALMDKGSQGDLPPVCEGCGLDLKGSEGSTAAAGEVDVVKIDLLPVRPDMLDPGGLARALRIFLGRTKEPVTYKAAKPKFRVSVDDAMTDRAGAYRPFVSCGIIRGFRLDDTLIPVVMKLQENLHWAMGRDRKLASIGIYDLATLKGNSFRYRPVRPDAQGFVPLMCDPNDPDSLMTPKRILEEHPKGVAYAHLLKGRSAYPLLEDEAGNVLSMPPIINSEATRVSAKSTDLFIDVTGLSERLVHRTLVVTATSLLELVPSASLEQVEIVYPDRTVVTPDLEPDSMQVDHQNASRIVGAQLPKKKAKALLEKMGHAVADITDGPLQVQVPQYRNDVMHEVDLIEDIAIAYGYDALELSLVPTMTVGQPLPEEELASLARESLTGQGLLEMVTLPMTCPEAAYDRVGLERRDDCLILANPVSVEQTMLRTHILPGLLGALSANIRRELPHRIFEVGDVTVLDSSAETGAVEIKRVAVAQVGIRMGLADARTVAEAALHELGFALRVRSIETISNAKIRGLEALGNGELWIPGRAAALFSVADGHERPIGVMGEAHPAVLERLGLRAPTCAFEMALEAPGH